MEAVYKQNINVSDPDYLLACSDCVLLIYLWIIIMFLFLKAPVSWPFKKKTLSGNTAFYKADITRIHLSLYILHTVDPLLKHRILLLSNCNKHGQTRGIKTGFWISLYLWRWIFKWQKKKEYTIWQRCKDACYDNGVIINNVCQLGDTLVSNVTMPSFSCSLH